MKKVVINNIEKKLNEKLSIFTFKGEKDYKVRRKEEGGWYVLEVFSTGFAPITSSCIESVQEVLKPYRKKWHDEMFYGVEKTYVWDEKKNDVKAVPCIAISMKMEEK